MSDTWVEAAELIEETRQALASDGLDPQLRDELVRELAELEAELADYLDVVIRG